MTLSAEDIRALVAEFQASDWDSMTLSTGDVSIAISRSGGDSRLGLRPLPDATGPDSAGLERSQAEAPPTVAAEGSRPASEIAAAEESPPPKPDGHRLMSPTVGLFWRSPQPGAPPFVVVGQHVEAEDTVCIVEVMKLMQHVKAGVAGTVASIEPATGVMVEHGTLLMVIIPDA